jgi:opacity protein-like surface antigen
MRKVSWILSAVALTAFVSTAAAQDAKPAPMPAPAPKGTIVYQAPAHGGHYAMPLDSCCDSGHGGGGFNFVDSGIDDRVSDSENDEPNGIYDAEPAWDLGFRIWGGFTNCDGYGARVRFFWWDSTFDTAETGEVEGTDPVLPRNQVNAEMELWVLDVEGTASASVGGMEVLLSGGIRFASVETSGSRFASDSDPFDQIYNSRAEFSGYGPTLAVEGRGTMGCLGIFAGTRVSLLFGETDLEFNFTDAEDGDRSGSMVENDDVVYVIELTLGAEYNFCCGGCDGFIRAALEAQLWGGATLDGFVSGPGLPDPRPHFNGLSERTTANDNLGLVGLTIGAGLKY